MNFVIQLYIYFKCTQQQVRKELAGGSEAPQKKKSAFGWKAIFTASNSRSCELIMQHLITASWHSYNESLLNLCGPCVVVSIFPSPPPCITPTALTPTLRHCYFDYYCELKAQIANTRRGNATTNNCLSSQSKQILFGGGAEERPHSPSVCVSGRLKGNKLLQTNTEPHCWESKRGSLESLWCNGWFQQPRALLCCVVLFCCVGFWSSQ